MYGEKRSKWRHAHKEKGRERKGNRSVRTEQHEHEVMEERRERVEVK